MTALLVLLLVTVGLVGVRGRSQHRARARLLAAPLNDAQRRVVAEQVPLTRKLPPDLAIRLEGKINLFLDQIRFHGANGLEVTDEMRLSIAAQACLLVVNSDTWYANLRTIIVYPGAFASRQTEHKGYVVTERRTARLGESWARGPVVLSWADAEDGALDETDGHNVVLHEFAHQIDALTGRANGAPLLSRGQSFADWEHAFLGAYDRHLANLRAGRETVFDPYGASGHEEFFAVAVEVFFERPTDLRREDPEVYAQLAKLFTLDPASWG